MKFENDVAFLLLLFESFFFLVIGQTINEKEKSDCTKLNNFLNGDAKDYANDCCEINGIKCDNGYITSIKITKSIKTNFNSFPFFSKIESLEINNGNFNEITDNLLNLTTLKRLSLDTCQINTIPPTIKNLSQLEYLKIRNNNVLKKIPEEIFEITNLKQLYLDTNVIEIISPAIQNLSQLEYLDLSNNRLKKLPNELFNLRNLKQLNLNYNLELTIKINNFGNSVIENCNFSNITISCYEPNTCKTIRLKGKSLSDEEAKNELKICTGKEQSTQNDNLNSLFIMGGIILGSIFIILIGIFVTFKLIKKNISKRRIRLNLDNVQYISDNDDEVDIGMNSSNTNSSFINHRGNNNYHSNKHINIIRNNLNQNSSNNDYNYRNNNINNNNSSSSSSSSYSHSNKHLRIIRNTLNQVILKNSTSNIVNNQSQNSDSFKPITNDNQIIVQESINMNYIITPPPPSYDESSMSMSELLPEYTEFPENTENTATNSKNKSKSKS